MSSLLRRVLAGLVAELVEEYCGAKYRKLELELANAKARIAQLENET